MNNFLHKSILCSSLALALMMAGTLSAATLVLRTGVDGALTPLADGALDTDWTISTDGGNTFVASKVLFPAQICCGLETVSSEAKWVADQSITAGSQATGFGVNNQVRLRHEFDLTGFDLSTVALSGTWRLADDTDGLFLNGSLISGTAVSQTWDGDETVNVAAGSPLFIAGQNVFEMRGTSRNSQWDGLWFSGEVTGDLASTVPEPSTLVLLPAGLGGLLLAVRRQRR